MLTKTSLHLTLVAQLFWAPNLIDALHGSCSNYFDGFTLHENYNPYAPPDVEKFEIKSKVIVREISKVTIFESEVQ